MSYAFPPDVAKLVQDFMATGDFRSEDEVLRDALATFGQFINTKENSDQEYQQAVVAVQEGMADMEAGRMRPLRELIDEAKQ